MIDNALPISVLIPTMNRPEALKRTLNTYMSGEYIPNQIIVVDQSVDQLVAEEIKRLVESYATRIEVVYFYQEQASSTKARNNAFTFSKNEIIIWSDDDIDAYDDTLKNVYDIMQDKKIAMIGALDDNTMGSQSKLGYFFGTKSFSKRRKGHVTSSVLGRYPNKIRGQIETEWAMGYFFVTRKSLVEKWGMRWDENLTSYAYAEDLDYTYSYYKNARLENLKCVLDERIRVKHLASKEYRVPSKKSIYMYVVNRLYLSYKHNMGIKSRMAMRWCNFWMLIRKAVKKENWRDMFDASKYAKKTKEEIKKGNLSY